MAVRKFKPTTPGQRQRRVPDFNELTTDKPEKSLPLVIIFTEVCKTNSDA